MSSSRATGSIGVGPTARRGDDPPAAHRSTSRSTRSCPPTVARSTAASVAGPETKTLVVYDEPFWRADGLQRPDRPSRIRAREVTIDASPRRGDAGRARVVHVRRRRRAASTAIRTDQRRQAMRRRAHGAASARRERADRRSSRPRGGPRSGRGAAPWRTSRPGSSPATARCSASRSAGCIGPAPRPRRRPTARSIGAVRSGERAAAEVLAN